MPKTALKMRDLDILASAVINAMIIPNIKERMARGIENRFPLKRSAKMIHAQDPEGSPRRWPPLVYYLETSSPNHFFAIFASVPSSFMSFSAELTLSTSSPLPLRKAKCVVCGSPVSKATFRFLFPDVFK